MSTFTKQITRKAISSYMLIFLLILSILVLSIGYSSWQGANKQYDAIDHQYTTIGIHSGFNYENFYNTSHSSPTGIDSTLFDDGSVFIGPQDAALHAATASSFISSNESVLLSAHVMGLTSLSSGMMNILDYNVSHDTHCYNLAVFAIECLEVERNEEPFMWDGYTVYARVIDEVCLHKAYDLPPENDIILIQSSLFTEDGEIPFKAGKKYLVRGRYWDYTIDDLGYETIIDEDGNEVVQFLRGRDIEYGTRFLQLEGDGSLVDNMSSVGRNSGVQNFTYDIVESDQTGLLYFTTPSLNCWPYYVEYEGEWNDYIESDFGSVWKEEIIPNFKINHESAPVILTDNIDSLYLFNTGDASIMEGRKINSTEYTNGSPVCLISAPYAKLNNLSIGDSIRIDYYNTGYEQAYCVIASINSQSSLTIKRKPLTENTRLGITKDYTIVGIYSSPEWVPGVQNFHADTIFVPKLSIPDAEKIVPFMSDHNNGTSLSMLNSITIKNGSIDEFESHMEEKEMGGVYLFFDQGYTEAADAVQTLAKNAQRIMITGVAMFILSSLIFLLLYIRRSEPVIQTMRLIGVSSENTWKECLTMLLFQEIIAVIFGNALAISLYDYITQMVLSTSLELSYGSVILCGTGQLLILFGVGMLWTHSVANRNLMQKR